MLLHGTQLLDIPVMGLQTGTQLATTKLPVIDPSNLKIVAYEVEGPMLAETPAYLRVADVRELGSIGMIIDSSDEFIGPSDVIAIKKVLELHFKLIGLNVIDELKHKLGKVNGYNVETDSFVIQQLTVKQGLIKSLSDTELLVHRSQIIEINDHSVIIKAGVNKLEPIAKPAKLNYANPFRSPTPQA